MHDLGVMIASVEKANEHDLPSKRLLELALAYENIVVMAHNNPDPDAISSGWAIVHLIRERIGKTAAFVASGEIVRAENRKMVFLLEPPLQLNTPITSSPRDLLIIIDCDVKAANHPPIDPKVQPVAVIDHHVDTGASDSDECVFKDLRPGVASTASIAASYLNEQGLEPPANLATALVYGIRTETKAGETDYSPLDREMLAWVTRYSNPSWVAQIEDATLRVPYFSDMALAFQRTTLHGDTAFCVLSQCQGPESVGEVADLLLRCETIQNVFCGAIFRNNLILSVRTQDPARNAAKAVVLLLAGIGHGGGHPHRAGGIIHDVGNDSHKHEELFTELRKRWLEICHAEGQPETRLVSRTSILNCLG